MIELLGKDEYTYRQLRILYPEQSQPNMGWSVTPGFKMIKIKTKGCPQIIIRMVCVRKCDGGIPISHEELEMEYQRGLEALEVEQDKVRQEESKKPRRKIPKAGCYPTGFSVFTGKKVTCTISLSEIRKDIAMINSASESNRSGYLNDTGSLAKRAWEQGVDSGTKRHCRLNPTLRNFVHPYSDAEDRREIQHVLRQSMLEQTALPLCVFSKRKNRG
jgi:hypothetical protein